MGKGKRILIVDNSIALTGAIKSITSVTKTLTAEFEFVFCVSNHSAIFAWLESNKIQYFGMPFLEIQKSWRLLLYIPTLIINTFRVYRLMKELQLKVIHVNDLYNMVGVLIKIFVPSVKLVYHVRLLPSSYASYLYPIWTRFIFRYSDVILNVSNTVFKSLPESSKKIMIYDGLPLPQVENEQVKFELFTFLYPGNFIRGKGQQYAVEAFNLAQDQLGKSNLIFVGSDLGKNKNKVFLSELKQQVKSHNLTEKVIFIEDSPELDQLYKSSHIVLNFSESESFSMTCLESLLFGTPVIATRCGGPEEIIEHEINGLLVGNKVVDEMATAMVRIYRDPDFRSKLSNQQERTAVRFSLHESSEKLRKVYESLIVN